MIGAARNRRLSRDRSVGRSIVGQCYAGCQLGVNTMNYSDRPMVVIGWCKDPIHGAKGHVFNTHPLRPEKENHRAGRRRRRLYKDKDLPCWSYTLSEDNDSSGDWSHFISLYIRSYSLSLLSLSPTSINMPEVGNKKRSRRSSSSSRDGDPIASVRFSQLFLHTRHLDDSSQSVGRRGRRHWRRPIPVCECRSQRNLCPGRPQIRQRGAHSLCSRFHCKPTRRENPIQQGPPKTPPRPFESKWIPVSPATPSGNANYGTGGGAPLGTSQACHHRLSRWRSLRYHLLSDNGRRQEAPADVT